MAKNVFTYGVLVYPEIFQSVSLELPINEPAKLHNHQRYYVEGKPYPGVKEEIASSVSGVLYRDVSDHAISRLNYFEDEIYTVKDLNVTLSSGATICAQCYVVDEPNWGSLSQKVWDPERFAERDLPSYQARIDEWMKDYK